MVTKPEVAVKTVVTIVTVTIKVTAVTHNKKEVENTSFKEEKPKSTA